MVCQFLAKVLRQYNGGRQSLSQWGPRQLVGYLHAKSEVESQVTTPIKSNSRWIEDLHVIASAIKFLGENLVTKFCGLVLGNSLLVMISKTQAKISLFSGLLSKRNSIKIFVNHISDIGPISIICKDLIQLNKKTIQFENG